MSVVFQVPPVPTTVAQLGCESPRQPPPGRCCSFPYIHSPAELIEKRYFQDTLRLIFFFSKKYLYLHKTIKPEQLSPQKLFPSGATAGCMRWSLFTSDSFAQQYSAGKFSFFRCKDYFFVPLFLPSLPLHTARSVFTTGTRIRQGHLCTARLVSREKGSGWVVEHAQPSLSVFKLQSQHLELTKLISYYKRHFLPILLI